jgi:cation diffusion facilitator CzcD-associated flavoprotein CzcO
MSDFPDLVDVVVIGAGQAGLSAAYHLGTASARTGRPRPGGLVVLDSNAAPGGAWQHRWRTLTVADVHGIYRLPGVGADTDVPTADLVPSARASTAIPAYFADYERRWGIDVERPVQVRSVRDSESDDADRLLDVVTDAGTWRTRAVVNATGTWTRPFVPSYPGLGTFRGTTLHTAGYDGPDAFAGQHVVVVGGGASAVQLLAEVSTVATTTWVTRQPPRWRTGERFTADIGREVVARVEERVRAGLPPESVVGATGLRLRPQEADAAARGVYGRRPMFARIEPNGVRWADGSYQHADAILWCTGFRAALDHLAPLRLREVGGGIRMDGTTVVRDPRIQLVGYGPSASTIGANRAGRTAAHNVVRLLTSSPELAVSA